MNLTVNSQALATELRLIAQIVPSKPAIAILSHVLLTADDALGLWATDLEVGLNATCRATVHEPGSLALPAAKLLALVEQFVDGDVTLATEGRMVTIRCGAFKGRLQAMPTDDFPSQPEAEGPTSVVDGDDLRGIIVKTRYAVNAGGSRHILKGALLKLTSAGAAMVATDAKRLAMATTASRGPDVLVIVPAKALDALTSHLAGDCELTVGPKHLFFASNGRTLTSRTIDGTFPAYERIIPTDNQVVLEVDRAALSAALRRVNLVSEQNQAVYFAATTGQLTLSSSSVEVGSADEVVDMPYDGPPVKVCMNGDYVLDFLNVATGASVVVNVKDAKTGVLFTDGMDHVGVIMPMKGL